jgi:hypothetical protein
MNDVGGDDSRVGGASETSRRASKSAVPLRHRRGRATVARTPKGSTVKYVILIHSNPQPWGHPTSDYLSDFLELPHEQREAMSRDFEALLRELSTSGELVTAEALADPASSRIYRWADGEPLPSDGPYAESKEHLAGFFLIDVESPARAEAIAARFASPGDTVELRPAMWPGGDDQ